MTLGDGIFWSTALVLFSLAIFQISKRKKWRVVGKIFGGLLLAGAVIAGGVWGWNEYLERPQVLTGISGIELGMSKVDITLKKGKPNNPLEEPEWDENEATYKSTMVYGDSKYSSSDRIGVALKGDSPSQVDLKAWRICYFNGWDKISGIGFQSSASDLTNKFGEADEVFVAEDGLSKRLNFNRWNLSATVEADRVKYYCVQELQ